MHLPYWHFRVKEDNVPIVRVCKETRFPWSQAWHSWFSAVKMVSL